MSLSKSIDTSCRRVRVPSMDKKTQKFQLQMAADMGYDITSPKEVENLIACIRYCDLSFSDRKLRDPEIADRLGISLHTLASLKQSDSSR